jgi:1,4-dihydroxy-2-naphthoyl-CoA hydrolase
MSIWFNKNLAINDFAHWGKNTLSDHIGIEFTAIGDDYLIAKMPVDSRTHQPYGLLHGGASVVLAETLGSVASALVVDHSKFLSLGIEINANHLKSVKSGFVYGKVSPLHIGGTLHVWEIKITDDNNQLICVCRLTVAIRKR